MNNLPANHLLGIEFFRLADSKSLDSEGYFDCLDLLRTLFRKPDFENSTPGFYINYITNIEEGNDGGNSVRLTYFTVDAQETDNAIKNFVKMNNEKIGVYEATTTRRPITKDLENCDPALLRFREFLNTYTHIGLDLLENFGRLCTRRLIATYRFDDFPLPSSKSFFESLFYKHSEFFRKLSNDYSAQQLWEDLDRKDSRGVWVHFLVNMLLPGDFNTYGIPVPEEIKKLLLDKMKLDVPDDWKLDCNF